MALLLLKYPVMRDPRYFSSKDEFVLSRELQFRRCNHGELHASPHKAREEHFYREEKEVGVATVNRVHNVLLAETCRKEEESFFFLLGFIFTGYESSLSWSLNSID